MTPIYERLESVILTVQREGTERREDGAIVAKMGRRTFTAQTTPKGWVVTGPDFVGAAPELRVACRYATIGH